MNEREPLVGIADVLIELQLTRSNEDCNMALLPAGPEIVNAIAPWFTIGLLRIGPIPMVLLGEARET